MKIYSITCGIGFTKDNVRIDPEKAAVVVRVASRKACEDFGGVSVVCGEGGWIHPSGAYIVESFARFEIMASDRLERKVKALRSYLQTILEQESVLLTVREETVL